MDQYKKITFNFPVEAYVYLKMSCAKKGMKMREFLTQAVIREIETYEDEWDKESLEAAKREIEQKGIMNWEEMEKDLGWRLPNHL